MARRTAQTNRGGAASRRAPSGPPMNPMAAQVGPEFHDDLGMRDALGAADEPMPAATFAGMVARREVLAVGAFDGTLMFPHWQVRDGAVLPGLAQVLAAMEGQPAWSVGLWLTTENETLGGRTPRSILEDAAHAAGADAIAPVVEEAGATARRWS